MSKIELRETQWAVHDPDVYSGPTCNQVRARWRCWADGDKGGADYQAQPIAMAAKTFPPGTKITISEPICPKCQELREPILPLPKRWPFYKPKCRCGFDWEAWVGEQFS